VFVQLENMVSVELGATVSGKVARVNEAEVVVAISDGDTGIIRIPYSGQGKPTKNQFYVGQQVTARITACDQIGRYILTPLLTGINHHADEFERNFHKLNYVLNHGSRPATHTRERPLEERLRTWDEQVETALANLRKHRNKRLNEEP